MSIFTGAGVAIITPFHQDGSVNYEEFENLIEFQIENGTDAVIAAGTTGEASTLSHQEHLEVIRHCVDIVKGRVPVIAGTGSNCTETAVHLSREAQRYGADGVLLVSPYYNKATQNGLYEHFKKIASSIQIPALLYNVPRMQHSAGDNHQTMSGYGKHHRREGGKRQHISDCPAALSCRWKD